MAERQFWLSFCDPNCPKGSQFLGVAIVEVSAVDALLVDPNIKAKRQEVGTWTGKLDPEDSYRVAAMQKAWEMGCNPGGEIATFEVMGDEVQRHRDLGIVGRLLSEADLRSLDLIE